MKRIRIITERRIIYRAAGGPWEADRSYAYLHAAYTAWNTEHPGCTHDDCHCRTCNHREEVVRRLARWLMWRDDFLAGRNDSVPPHDNAAPHAELKLKLAKRAKAKPKK